MKERIEYGLNPIKTNETNLVSTYGCDKNTAASEFAFSQAKYYSQTGRTPKNAVLAYQIRQSFKPGEVTPEEANAIGYELAERYLKGKFAFVVATHIDKAHIHNHIYFNSVSLDCTHKHRDCKRSAKDIARLSDLICIEHQLSTITNPQHRNTSYTKWEGYTPYLSHRDLLRNDIDEVLSMIPKDFDKFLELMKEQGYEIDVLKHRFDYLPGLNSVQFGFVNDEKTELCCSVYLRSLEVSKFLKINLSEIFTLVSHISEEIRSIQKINIYLYAFKAQYKEHFSCFEKAYIDTIGLGELAHIIYKDSHKLFDLLKNKFDMNETIVNTSGLELLYDIMHDSQIYSVECINGLADVINKLKELESEYRKNSNYHTIEPLENNIRLQQQEYLSLIAQEVSH